jgi:NAD(P)-dependent dehydrogenase (short-subunit alcohol dehydrogenase family)
MSYPAPLAVDHPFLPKDTFADDVVLVTGGGTGLGKAMGESFARMGAKIVIASRKDAHLAAGVAAIEALGGKAHAIAMDVRRPEDIERAFDVAERALGPVSILINNAAGRFMAPAEDITPNGWRAVVQIVLDGTFFCSREFHKRRLAAGRGGAILNIGAAYVWTGAPGSAHSAAAKAGVANLTQTLAVEWAVDGIRVNNLVPGHFPHADTAAHMKGPWQEDKHLTVPAGRAGALHELGWAACFLCSPFANYISGHSLVIDAGQWLRHKASGGATFEPVRDWARAERQ